MYNFRRAWTFAFEQSKCAAIGGLFIRVDKQGEQLPLHVVEEFTQESLCSFAVTTPGKIKINSAAPAVDGPVQRSPAALDIHVRFINMPRIKIGRVCHYQRSRFSISGV